jgi:hypothetical protein
MVLPAAMLFNSQPGTALPLKEDRIAALGGMAKSVVDTAIADS